MGGTGAARGGPPLRQPPPTAAYLNKHTVQELTEGLLYNTNALQTEGLLFNTNALLPSNRSPPQPSPRKKSELPSPNFSFLYRNSGAAPAAPHLPALACRETLGGEAWRGGPNARHPLPYARPGKGRSPQSSRVPSGAGRGRQSSPAPPGGLAEPRRRSPNPYRLSPPRICSAPPGTLPLLTSSGPRRLCAPGAGQSRIRIPSRNWDGGLEEEVFAQLRKSCRFLRSQSAPALREQPSPPPIRGAARC